MPYLGTMFQFVMFVALCGILLAESKPTQNVDVEFTDNNFRVVRSAQHVQNAMNLAGQTANEGIQAATKGLSILSTTAQQGINAATQIAAQAAKSVTSII